MRDSVFDYVGNLDTLLAVIIGAFLATSGALVADIIQDRTNRGRREREAARFFGEIITSIDQLVDFSVRSQAVGDRWGSITVRLFQTVLNEIAVYDRNRERLFDIRDMALRSRIHVHILTEAVPLRTIVENAEEMADVERTLADRPDLPADIADKLRRGIADIRGNMDAALETVQREQRQTPGICKALERLARVKFGREDQIQRYEEAMGIEPGDQHG